uniref:ALIX_LYPXL_bnd domain-containing protein n=1 Tax=Schistosoma mansoni TaxID=6183 RepID=A0A5K4FE44_SCHMA
MRNKSGEYPSAIIILGDLVQTEKEARNTSDSNKRGILEREVEDLINGINALEASPELKAAEERNLDTTDKYFNALRDLVQTEKEARNTSDSNKRGILEREVEDLINEINALEASPKFKAAEERNLDTTDKYFNALNDHLEILKNLEIQRIDVLELLSSKERIQMYESILQEELNSV